MDNVVCRICSVPTLLEHREALRSGAALPVGSVEYVRAAMAVGNIAEPSNISYPPALAAFLRRKVTSCSAAKVRTSADPVFVKPKTTKAFTGFVFRPGAAALDYDEHDREQLEAFERLDDELVWTSPTVSFLCEHRYYVLHGEIAGVARYDPDGEDSAPEPDMVVVREAIKLFEASAGCPAAYALDVGVLSCGQTALVEVNDAWALGLYGRKLEPRKYLAMLAARWQQIVRAGV